MFSSCSCCDTVFGTPCCIEYDEPVYGVVEYAPTCQEVSDGYSPSSRPFHFIQIASIPRIQRQCGLSGGQDCYVKKITDTAYTGGGFGPPIIDEYIHYASLGGPCIPGEDLGNGVTCPNPTGLPITQTVEKIFGSFDPKYSCHQRRSRRDPTKHPWYIEEITPDGITIDNDWYGWWENYCPSCHLCNKGKRATETCVPGSYDTFVMEDGECSQNMCVQRERMEDGKIEHVYSTNSSGKHYFINDNSWKNGSYCFGTDCLVNRVVIGSVAPYGSDGMGITQCTDVDNCFMSVREVENIKMPNPGIVNITNTTYGVCYLGLDINSWSSFGGFEGTSIPGATSCIFPIPAEPGQCDYDECDDGEGGEASFPGTP